MGKKRILYLGLDPSRFECDGEVVCFPIIQIVPRPFNQVEDAFRNFSTYTHILITSRSTLLIVIEYARMAGISLNQLKRKNWIAVGSATASLLKSYELSSCLVAEEECGEGVIAILKSLPVQSTRLFFPHSALARTLIVDFLKKEQFIYEEKILYTTIQNPNFPEIDLDSFDEIVFTSPSTVNAFFNRFGTFPKGKKAVTIGPITEQAFLQKSLVNF